MTHFFKLDRIARAVCEAPALAAALGRDSAAYAARGGVDLVQLLGRCGRPDDVRAAVCLLIAFEGARPWRASERKRIERVTIALERLLLKGRVREAERAADHLRALRSLISQDDAAREAAADAALAKA